VRQALQQSWGWAISSHVAASALIVGVLSSGITKVNAITYDIAINEINYAPNASSSDSLRFEYVEIYNRGTNPVALGGWQLRDVNSSQVRENLYIFAPMSLPSSAFLTIYSSGASGILAEDTDLGDGTGLVISTAWSGTAGLNNSGDVVEIVDSALASIDFVYYDEADTGEAALDDAAVAEEQWKNAAAIDTLSAGTTGRSIALRIDGATPNEVNPVSNAEDLDWMQYTLSVGGTPGRTNTPGLAGDYNGNGVVDAADYVVWRKGGTIQNEVDSPGTVNAADYTAWRQRFGNQNPASASSLGGATVPEPPTISLVFSGIAGLLSRHRKAVPRCH
jgi:hypothetical protein